MRLSHNGAETNQLIDERSKIIEKKFEKPAVSKGELFYLIPLADSFISLYDNKLRILNKEKKIMF